MLNKGSKEGKKVSQSQLKLNTEMVSILETSYLVNRLKDLFLSY